MNDAYQFLKLLDSQTEKFHFQWFREGEEVKVAAWNQFSSADKMVKTLSSLNESGVGVFVTINQTDGLARKNENIQKVRAVFIDIDKPIQQDNLYKLLETFPLKPHIIVESSVEKYHIYWLVEDFPLAQFRNAQLALADYFNQQHSAICDRKICDLARVMRLPGFYHNKAKPFLSHIIKIETDLPRYKAGDVIKHLNLDGDSANQEESGQLSKECLVKILALLEPHKPVEGHRNEFTAALTGFLARLDVEFQSIKFLVQRLSSDPVSPTDAKRAYESFKKGQRMTGGQRLLDLGLSTSTLSEIRSLIRQEIKISDIELFDEQGKLRKPLDILIQLGSRHEFFCDESRQAYVKVYQNGSYFIQALESDEFYELLRSEYYGLSQRGVRMSDLKDAASTLVAKAKHDGLKERVYKRVAKLKDKVCIDLCNSQNEIIEITAQGWSVIPNITINFIRTRSMKALASPLKKGDLSALWSFLNVAEEDRVLVWGWLTATLAGIKPFAILLITGVEGSGKSTLARFLRTLVDPSTAGSAQLPKNPRDLVAILTSGYLLNLDNISFISSEMSDMLCRVSTGGVYQDRKLFTNKESDEYEISSPVVINGIDNNARRADLLSRCVLIETAILNNNLPLDELEKKFHESVPGILGALCDAIATALKMPNTISMNGLPRLSDFSRFVMVAESTGKWFAPGTFIKRYRENLQNNTMNELEGDSIYSALIKAISSWTLSSKFIWQGSATELIDFLNNEGGMNEYRTAQIFSRHLKRIEKSLSACGIEIVHERKAGKRLITIRFEKYLQSLEVSKLRNDDHDNRVTDDAYILEELKLKKVS